MKMVLNQYIKRPLFYDLVGCALVGVLTKWLLGKFDLQVALNTEDLRSIITDEMTTSISLVGFILASLTIIVTFKDNITRKIQKEVIENTSLNNQLTGLEILFSSKHYKRIVGVFTSAAFIFLVIFLLCSLSKIYINIIGLGSIYYLALSSVLILTSTVLRCLVVLYNIIKLQINN